MAGREETDVTASQEDDTSLASSSASASAATSPTKEQEQQDDKLTASSTVVEQKVEETTSEKAEDGESIRNTECAIVVDECTSPEVDNKNTMLSSTIDAKNRLKATNEKNSIEDSGTESSEDLRVLAADLREKIQMHSSKNSAQGQKDKDVISEVAEALTKLETSLKDGEDIHLNRGKRNALLTLVANLQNHLLCSEDGPLNSPTLETSSPEYDVRNNRHRFARKRNRANRHTVGVSKEELADARKYIEDLVLMESLSNVATPDASTDTTPTSMKRNSIGDPLSELDLQNEPKPQTLQLSKSSPKLSCENNNYDTSQVLLRVNSQNHLGPRTRPLSDSFPEKNVSSAYQRALERSKLQRSPEPVRARFSNKKQLMKRANTIDIPKSQQPPESESDGEDNSVGLLRAVQVNVKQKPRNKVPEFVPKTENDHKFLAFLQKTSHHHGLGWNQNKSVTNWTNKFGNIKSAFESGKVSEKSALKPPMHPHQPSKLMSKSPSQLPESKQIFSPPPVQYAYQQHHQSVNPYHQRYASQQDLQSHPQPVAIPKPVPINQFIHASKSVFKPVKPQTLQFQPIKNDETYNQPKWNVMSTASSPSGFSTHSDKWKNTSTCSSPLGGLPWTSKPTTTNSVLKLASSKFANPEPEEYKPKSSLNRGYSMKQLNNYNMQQEPLQNSQMYQKRPSLPDTLNPYGFNSYPQNSLTNPNHQPLVLTNNNPTYYPDGNVKSSMEGSPMIQSPKTFDEATPTPYHYTSPLPPQSPQSYKRLGPVPYSPDATTRRDTYGTNKNYLSVDDSAYRGQPNYMSDDPEDGMEYKAEIKVMKSPISHQAVKVGSRLTHGNDKHSESAKGLLDVMRRVSPKVQPTQQSYMNQVQERRGPHIDNVQKQKEKFDHPDDYIFYEPQKPVDSRPKHGPGFEKQRQMFDKPDDYDEYQGRKPVQYLPTQKADDYLYYEPQDRPLPVDRPDRFDRKVPDPDTQMKEEELRLLKERQAEIERQLFMKAEQERVEAIEREKFVKAQQERQKEIERELLKAQEEQFRKEEYERQMVLRAQQEELERQRIFRAQQEEIDRQRALRSQQEEMERQRILRSQQEALRVQQEALRAQQEEIDRQRALRVQQEERHLKAQREEIDRQNLLKAQRYEMERQNALKAQQVELERQKALKAEAERQNALRAEADRQRAIKAESERQKALKAQQLVMERQKSAAKEKSKKSKMSDADKKAQLLQEEQDELEKQKFLKAQKEHQEFYQKERQKREEELQMIRAQKQNSIEEYSRRFSESELKVGQRRLVEMDSHDLPDYKENTVTQNSIQVIEERRNSIQSQIQRMEAVVGNSRPEILPKPSGIAPKKPMIRSKTESAIDVEKLDWQPNPIYNGNDSKPNVIFNNVTLKTRALVSQDSKEEDGEVVKSSLENNMVLKKYGPPQRHCYLPNSYQSPLSSTANLSQSRPNLTKSVSNTTTNHVTKITAQFAAQQSVERHSPEPQLRRSKSGHTLVLPKMYEGKIEKTQLVQKQKTVEAYFGGSKSPNPIEKSEITTKASSRRFKNKKSSANGSLSRSHTMPQLNDLNLLDESNIEDAFDQLISTAKL